MTTDENSLEHQKLLQFLYLAPVALIKVRRNGEILFCNGKAIQLLQPLTEGGTCSNLFDAVKKAEFIELFQNSDFTEAYLAHNKRETFIVETDDRSQEFTYSFEVIQTDQDEFIVSFKNITNVVQQEKIIQESISREASNNGRIDAATQIIHDIGNAVSGIGSKVSTHADMTSMEEVDGLARLQSLMEQNRESFVESLGRDRTIALMEFVSAIREGILDKFRSIQDAMAYMSSIVEHVNQIIEIHRTYAKADRNRKRMPVNLKHCIEDAIIVSEQLIQASGVLLNTDLVHGRDIQVAGDSTNLVQVVVNLIKNSCEAMKKSSLKHLLIKLSKKDGMARLEVVDSGIGFDQQQKAKLFQIGNTTKQSGMGVGLNGCAKIIESHHGAISMESEGPGRGARAIIELPMVKSVKDASNAA